MPKGVVIVKVRQIMSAPVTTVERTDTLAFAEELMNVEGVHHLPVVEGDVLVGLVSHRDIVAASISTLSKPSEEDDLDLKRKVEVARVMHGIVETAQPNGDAADAAGALLALKIGCLPVVDERFRVVGIVTSTDFVKLARAQLAAPRKAEAKAPRRAPATKRARPARVKRTAAASSAKSPRKKPAPRGRPKATGRARGSR
jgi:CBS domain-containing membrane protein